MTAKKKIEQKSKKKKDIFFTLDDPATSFFSPYAISVKEGTAKTDSSSA
jgi:hypothetical protein